MITAAAAPGLAVFSGDAEAMVSATSGLREVAAAWRCWFVEPDEVVRVADRLLSSVEDDSAIWPIAALPSTVGGAELGDLLEDVFAAAGDIESLRGERLLELAMRWACGRYLAGRFDGRYLARWADHVPRSAGPGRFRPFAELDEDRHSGRVTAGVFDARLAGLAQAFLDVTADLVA